jgi:hypothetical protein
MQRMYVLSHADKRERNEKTVNGILRLVIVFLVGIIACEVVFQFLIAPNLYVRNVIVKGNGGIDKEEIVARAGLDERKYYFSLDTREVEKRVETIPRVKTAACEKLFPDSLLITIVRRTPVGCALAEERGRSVPVEFDDSGIVIAAGREIETFDVPVFSGLAWESIVPGTRLPEAIIPFLADLGRLRDASKAVFDFISEIKVEPRGSGFELVFYTIPFATRIRAGSTISESMLTYGLMVCDTLKKNGLESRVRELDFRSRDVVLRLAAGAAEE